MQTEKNTMKKALFLIFCLLMIITIGAGQTAAAEKKNDAAKQTWSAKSSSNDYKIGAGDVLEITIFLRNSETR